MLAGARSVILFCFLFAATFAAVLPVQAQTNGASPSVTSMGFGGRFMNGVSPSVTSLGTNSYSDRWSVFGSCCANFVWPANRNTGSERHRHRKKKEDAPLVGIGAIGVMEPVYIPFAAAEETGDDEDSLDRDSLDQDLPNGDSPDGDPPDGDSLKHDSGLDSGPRNPDPPVIHARRPDAGYKSLTTARPNPDDTADPVATQLSTALVFKDGHRSEVVNYAIVGDTLFDFDGRKRKILLADLDLPATHKANDDRGVDFQIPANTVQ
jgi:hypothetical protein